jgi:ligand-binding sensor domain-containing protein
MFLFSMSSKKWIPLLSSIFFFITASRAQDLRFDHLSVDKGLSQGNVWDVKQDSLGFIWIATEDGLNLFDGYRFTVYKNNPDDSTSLTNNNINSLAEDHSGNIWVATREGLNRYNRISNRFEQFLHDPNNPRSLPHNSITNVFCDSRNTIWACTNDGLARFNRETHDFDVFRHKDDETQSLAGNTVKCIVEDKNKTLWVGTMQGLSAMSGDGRFTSYYHQPGNTNSLSSDQVMSLFVDSDNMIWVGTFDNGLTFFNPKANSFIQYLSNPTDPTKLAGAYVYNINQDKSGNIWVADDGALCLLKKGSHKFILYQQDLSDEFSINSNTVTDVLFDANDVMWVSTRFGGVNVYDPGKYVFAHYKHNGNNNKSLSGNNVQGMDEDKNGNLWIGVDGGGLNRFNRKTGDFERFRHDPKNANSIRNDKILNVKVDINGDVWSGMWDGGVTRYNPATRKFTRYIYDPANPRSLSNNNIFDLMIDADGELWIATWGNGINKYNRDTDDFTRYVNDPSNPNSIPHASVVCIFQDHTGLFWAGSEDAGLFSFDKKTGTFKVYESTGKAGDISSNGIYSIFEDSKQRLWVGSSGAGLNLFNREKDNFTTLRQKDGLPNDAIVGILEDHNELWLSTNKGVSRFNPDSLTFRNYTESDGLQGDQFNRWSAQKLSSGDLAFGGTNGFNLFNPATIKGNAFVPPVYITNFKLFNEQVGITSDGPLKENILTTKSITLSYEQNFLEFEYTTLNYRQAEKNRYKHMLVGLQDKWVEDGAERKVSYTNLDPGEYVLRIIASNNDGVWNNEGATLHITIVPPFWQTWWFRTAVGALLISFIIGYYRYIKEKAKRQQADLERIIHEQTFEVKKQNEEILRKTESEKVQNWITEGLAFFGDVISKHKGSLDELSGEVLKNLVTYVKAQQGTLTVLVDDDPDDLHLRIVATYGATKARLAEQRIEIGAGLIGSTFKDGEPRIVDNLPENYLKIESGLGQAKPKALLLLPLRSDELILGVAELAFLDDISEVTKTFLTKVSAVIALNLHAANLNNKTTLLLQQAKEQTEELQAQEEEMRQNMEELEATQEELRRREQEYLKRIETLEAQLKK